jgi:hypothetical protein
MKNNKSRLIYEQMGAIDDILSKVKDFIGGDAEVDERLRWLQDKDYRNGIFEKEPHCIIVIRKLDGNDIPLVPACNRLAAFDPEVLKVGLKAAQRFRRNEVIDQGHLEDTIGRLKKIILISKVVDGNDTEKDN